MKMTHLAALAAASLAGCANTGNEESRESGGTRASALATTEAPVVPPMVVEDEADSIFGFLLLRHDADGDGRVARAEYGRGEELFGRLDRDGDGILSDADFERRGRGGPPAKWEAPPRGDGAPVGILAPDFELLAPSGEGPVRLSDFRGEQPVALIFGSYT